MLQNCLTDGRRDTSACEGCKVSFAMLFGQRGCASRRVRREEREDALRCPAYSLVSRFYKFTSMNLEGSTRWMRSCASTLSNMVLSERICVKVKYLVLKEILWWVFLSQNAEVTVNMFVRSGQNGDSVKVAPPPK